jgi:hypothetical protein
VHTTRSPDHSTGSGVSLSQRAAAAAAVTGALLLDLMSIRDARDLAGRLHATPVRWDTAAAAADIVCLHYTSLVLDNTVLLVSER